jgi:hypothetical protein
LAARAEIGKSHRPTLPPLKSRLLNALKPGGTEALKIALESVFKNPLVAIPVETIKGWIEAE